MTFSHAGPTIAVGVTDRFIRLFGFLIIIVLPGQIKVPIKRKLINKLCCCCCSKQRD